MGQRGTTYWSTHSKVYIILWLAAAGLGVRAATGRFKHPDTCFFLYLPYIWICLEVRELPYFCKE